MRRFPLDRLSALTLGTVQLGMPYGVAVPIRPPEPMQATQLLDAAWSSGIACFDTARAYGDAETALGRWLATRDRSEASPLIVSKFPPVSGIDAAQSVCDAAQLSRQALGVQAIDAYIAHRAEDLLLPGVADALRSLCDMDWIGCFGVSVYDPEELASVLAIPDISVVQVPASLLDRRFYESGVLDICADRGIVVFARSVFLQGVLFLEPGRLPDFLRPAAESIGRIQCFASEAGCPLASLALAAVIGMPAVCSAVIGVGNRAQLASNIEALAAQPGPDVARQAMKLCQSLPSSVIDPRQWR